MTRVYLRTSDDRMYNPTSDSKDRLVCWLRKIHWTLMHTCVHEEEPVCSDACVKHVLEEVQELIEKVKDLGGELGFLDLCPTARGCGGNKSVNEYLDKMAHELDHLHEQMRRFLKENNHRDHDYGHHVYPGVQKMLHTACGVIKSTFDDLVKRLVDMKMLDREIAQELRLH